MAGPCANISVFPTSALVVKLVDAPDSKSGSARSAGSSPARGTSADCAVTGAARRGQRLRHGGQRHHPRPLNAAARRVAATLLRHPTPDTIAG